MGFLSFTWVILSAVQFGVYDSVNTFAVKDNVGDSNQFYEFVYSKFTVSKLP